MLGAYIQVPVEVMVGRPAAMRARADTPVAAAPGVTLVMAAMAHLIAEVLEVKAVAVLEFWVKAQTALLAETVLKQVVAVAAGVVLELRNLVFLMEVAGGARACTPVAFTAADKLMPQVVAEAAAQFASSGPVALGLSRQLERLTNNIKS